MYCIIYRFNPKASCEQAFVECWQEMTALIKTELGGLGSRLHRADDGQLFAYAQWPDKASWEKMYSSKESGRMAELTAIWKNIADASEVVLSGEVLVDLFTD